MPYKSAAQRGLFHSKNSPVSAKVVAEFDRASKGQKGLPQHVAGGGMISPTIGVRRFNDRKVAGVVKPRKSTDLSFAAHLAMKTLKEPEIPWSSKFLRKVKP